jgi:multiple sugar transport system ATP-binding protein
MNLMAGQVEGGTFIHAAGRVDGVPASAERRILIGQRPEDLRLVAPDGADLRGTVFTYELLGDSGLVSVRAGGDLINVKVEAGRRFRMGDSVGLALDRSKLHLFDAGSGLRIEGRLQ